jgi:tol-pal system protein YbgF
VVQQDRQLRGMVQEQRRQLQEVERELERLRADMEEGHGRHPAGAPLDDRVTTLEGRVAELERAAGTTAAAGTTEPTSTSVTPPPPSSTLTMTTPTMPPSTVRPPAPAEDDPWRREIAREQTAAGAVNVPERAEYLGILDVLARQDCARAVPQLNTFASAHKDSALSDNALYWAARCYALRGDQNQAVSKFYDVVTRYPKGDKAPAALWAQGSLFVEMGDSPDARLAFSKLIRDYPSSEEASRARQKLTELEN